MPQFVCSMSEVILFTYFFSVSDFSSLLMLTTFRKKIILCSVFNSLFLKGEVKLLVILVALN